MNDVSRSPIAFHAKFIESLKTICSSGNSVLNLEQDIAFTNLVETTDGKYRTTLTNSNKDVSLDIIFGDTVATIIFNKYRINPYTLHRGCKIVSGDTASLGLLIPIGVSQQVINSTLNFVGELVYDCFNYKNFKL